ncbi:MAG: hypothetical protein ACREMZ_15615 [Gemmatimonadales bacterium]
MFARQALRLTTIAVLLAACGGDSSTGPSGPSGPPVLSSINGATAPSGPIGSTVSVEGENFGDTQGSSQIFFSDGLGGTIPAVIASAGDWTNTFILTTVPSGAATGDVVVQTSLGTSGPLTFTVTDAATFSPSTISWTATTALPTGRSGHATAFAQLEGQPTTRVVYSVGGADAINAPLSEVHYATVGADGTLGAWTATAALPAGLAFHGLVVATPANSQITAPGYLYVLGGSTDAAGTPTASIYRGSLAADGSVTSWSQVTSLPAPLHSMGAVIFQGDLYVFGGATTDNAPVANVYRAAIETGGGLGAWQSQAGLPFGRAYFGFGTFGGYLYTFGGDSGAVAPNSGSLTSSAINDVSYAKIDIRTGDLTIAGWTTNSSSLTKATSKHTAVVAGGNVLITAGLYNGASTGSSEQSYAQLNADGSVGSFNGATGANTIFSLGGGNLFNHAATGYTDGSGAFRVLVAGGDDVNLPGTKHTGVFFY